MSEKFTKMYGDLCDKIAALPLSPETRSDLIKDLEAFACQAVMDECNTAKAVAKEVCGEAVEVVKDIIRDATGGSDNDGRRTH